jgi:hypothetical protein
VHAKEATLGLVEYDNAVGWGAGVVQVSVGM